MRTGRSFVSRSAVVTDQTTSRRVPSASSRRLRDCCISSALRQRVRRAAQLQRAAQHGERVGRAHVARRLRPRIDHAQRLARPRRERRERQQRCQAGARSGDHHSDF
jgi:hypothetical protein